MNVPSDLRLQLGNLTAYKYMKNEQIEYNMRKTFKTSPKYINPPNWGWEVISCTPSGDFFKLSLTIPVNICLLKILSCQKETKMGATV